LTAQTYLGLCHACLFFVKKGEQDIFCFLLTRSYYLSLKTVEFGQRAKKKIYFIVLWSIVQWLHQADLDQMCSLRNGLSLEKYTHFYKLPLLCNYQVIILWLFPHILEIWIILYPLYQKIEILEDSTIGRGVNLIFTFRSEQLKFFFL
jgi:hypothetical protein